MNRITAYIRRYRELYGTNRKQWGRLPGMDVEVPLVGQIAARVYRADTDEWEDLGVVSEGLVVDS